MFEALASSANLLAQPGMRPSKKNRQPGLAVVAEDVVQVAVENTA